MISFWCEVNLNKLNNNIQRIKSKSHKKIMAVVKGNAYGLGADRITEFLEDKVDYFAVATVEESKKIKTSNEILILTPIIYEEDLQHTGDNIIFTVDNKEILRKINKYRKTKIHIYVDMGMNRFGVKPYELNNLVNEIITDYPNILIDGIYMHLHNTKNTKYTLNQIEKFKEIVEPFKESIPNIHCLNSDAVINNDFRELADFTNTIRIGNLIYGYIGQELGYEKIFSYYAKIIKEYRVKKGETIGYGNVFKARKDTLVGVLELGYIDHFGFDIKKKHILVYDILRSVYRHVYQKSNIFYKGKEVKIIGNPSMNNVLIDMEWIAPNSVVELKLQPMWMNTSIPIKYIRFQV